VELDVLAASPLLRFMKSGELVYQGAPKHDWLAGTPQALVSGAARTDGEWIWTDEMIYYLENYSILPPQAFLDHIQSKDYQVGSVLPDLVARAAQAYRA